MINKAHMALIKLTSIASQADKLSGILEVTQNLADCSTILSRWDSLDFAWKSQILTNMQLG